jgi:hypothetical protein
VPFLNRVMGAVKSLIGAGVQFRYCNSLGFMGAYSDLTPGHAPTQNQGAAANDAIGKANARIDAANAKLPAGATPQANIPTIDTSSGGTGLAQLDPALDEWWGHEGPLYPWASTSNGGPWQEVWAINVDPAYTDVQEHRVAIGHRKLGQGSTVDPAFGYFAESEFYFDCKESWEDDKCNGDDNAAYSIQWRARLRRLEFPEIGTLIGSYIGNFVANLHGIADAVRELRYFLQALPIGKLTSLVNPIINGAFEKLKEYGEHAAAKLGGKLNPGGISGSYH